MQITPTSSLSRAERCRNNRLLLSARQWVSSKSIGIGAARRNNALRARVKARRATKNGNSRSGWREKNLKSFFFKRLKEKPSVGREEECIIYRLPGWLTGTVLQLMQFVAESLVRPTATSLPDVREQTLGNIFSKRAKVQQHDLQILFLIFEW